MKFKELRESITSRMISMAVKHTTPKKKSMVKEEEIENSLSSLDKDKFKSKPKSYMDNDGGAAEPKNFNGADKYMDKGPATGTPKKNYMDKGPAIPPAVKENYPQIGDGIYLELDDVLIETEIVDETDDGYIIFMDQTAEDFINSITEAEYQGRDVQLNKPMAGDVAKSKVYVKGPSGRVVKVNFGDKNMTIKKNIPARRKSFRARHRCETPGPKHKARYWSCKAW